jgi:hypothetical protein
LRAVAQNVLTEYEEDMRQNGQARTIIDSPSKGQVLNSHEVSRFDYTDEVRELMQRSRGCELPGTFNPLIIGQLFTEQCRPWRAITLRTKDGILHTVYRATTAILEHVAVDETVEGIFRLISERIEILKTDLELKLAKLLEPHDDGHLITYNHYLIDNVQKMQSTRRREGLERTMRELFRVKTLE